MVAVGPSVWKAGHTLFPAPPVPSGKAEPKTAFLPVRTPRTRGYASRNTPVGSPNYRRSNAREMADGPGPGRPRRGEQRDGSGTGHPDRNSARHGPDTRQ